MALMRWRMWSVGAVLGVLLTGSDVEAGHNADSPKKHKVLFHFTEGDSQRASAVLTNVQNFVEVVGWRNIEVLELVVHGPGLRPFVAERIDPEVKAKVEALLTGGMSMGACQITMRRQSLKPGDLIDGLKSIPSGVVRVMELEEKGYAYIRP